jgi:hypothetical protein
MHGVIRSSIRGRLPFLTFVATLAAFVQLEGHAG